MCIAVPMRVDGLSQDNETATVSLGDTKLTVNVSLIRPAVGDYVLVHAGCALEVVAKDTAREILDLFAELEEFAADGTG